MAGLVLASQGINGRHGAPMASATCQQPAGMNFACAKGAARPALPSPRSPLPQAVCSPLWELRHGRLGQSLGVPCSRQQQRGACALGRGTGTGTRTGTVAFLSSAPLASQAAKWGLRLVSFYALLRLGIAKEAKGGAIDNAQRFISRKLFGDTEARVAKDAQRAAVRWKESTKGTLVRKLRVPSVSQGRKLLNSIATVLSEDDLFVDVASHKGCQVRRESAHSDSVCCYNVRALFDELPTPHLEVEITTFPPGPLTSLEYQKAQKLEAVLGRGNSI